MACFPPKTTCSYQLCLRPVLQKRRLDASPAPRCPARYAYIHNVEGRIGPALPRRPGSPSTLARTRSGRSWRRTAAYDINSPTRKCPDRAVARTPCLRPVHWSSRRPRYQQTAPCADLPGTCQLFLDHISILVAIRDPALAVSCLAPSAPVLAEAPGLCWRLSPSAIPRRMHRISSDLRS